jgi:hypothetical protein
VFLANDAVTGACTGGCEKDVGTGACDGTTCHQPDFFSLRSCKRENHLLVRLQADEPLLLLTVHHSHCFCGNGLLCVGAAHACHCCGAAHAHMHACPGCRLMLQ